MQRIVVVTERAELVAGLGDAELAVEARSSVGDGSTPAIAADAELDLARAVDVMLRADRVAAAVRAEPGRVAKAVRRVARGGVGKAHAHAHVLADFADKVRCQAAIAAQVAHMPSQRRAAIDQCVDELLMNALYDAPVAADGTRVFAGVATRERVKARTAATVRVEWTVDGERFVLVVRDTFGSLERDTVLRHLDKGLHAASPIAERAGGAGVGLFLVASEASELWFDVTPGAATEVTCVFDAGDRGLAELGFVSRVPAAQRTTAPRRLAKRYRIRRAIAVALVTSAVAGAGLSIAWLLRPTRIVVATTDGATVELDGAPIASAKGGVAELDVAPGRTYRVTALHDGYEAARAVVRAERGDNHVALALRQVATLELDSQPSGARVELDGHPAGTTPLRVTALAPGATVQVAIAHPGYAPMIQRVVVPAAGKTDHVVEKLESAPSQVLVRVGSEPPGAAIVQSGEPLTIDRTYTPAEIYVEVGQAQQLELIMPHHGSAEIPAFTPGSGSPPIDRSATLPPADR